MPRKLRNNTLALAMAAASIPTMVWLGLYGFAWNDYDNEAAPAIGQLIHGHLSAFLEQAPAYGGSLAIRAPFALLPGLWGGGSLAVYRLLALPCLLAAAVLGVWLVHAMRDLGAARLSRAVALGLCVANPLTLRALELGHPEDLLGAVLCAGAVILAIRERALMAGLLLGLAIANKEWAVLAAGPVLLALPQRRAAAAAVATAVAGTVLAPFLLARGASGAPQIAAAHSGGIFQPWQAWWFLGHHGAAVHGLFGVLKPGFRTPPAWIDTVAHPLIVLLVVPLSWLYARRPRVNRAPEQALLLLALLMLLRCALDPWDAVYYPLPFILALLSWECLTRSGPPVFALFGTVACWLLFQQLPAWISPDMQAVAFAVLALPAALAMAAGLYRDTPARRTALPRVSPRAAAVS